jgi:NitT/TauT family transport system substrate-binding protein
LTSLTVGTIPITSVLAPLALGQKQGFFADEGLDLKTTTAAGGASYLSALKNGQIQAYAGAIFPIIPSYANGLKLRVISGVNSYSSDNPSLDEELVTVDPNIKSAADLVGKTVAVNTLGSVAELAERLYFKDNGIDPNKVNFVALGFPDMPGALSSGSVDAIDEAEPFLSQALAEISGAHSIAKPYLSIADPVIISGWVTSAEYDDANHDVLLRFYRAFEKSKDYAREHLDEVRQVMVETVGMDEALAKSMTLADIPEGQPPAALLESMARDAADVGLLDSPLPDDTDFSDMLVDTSAS